jgi:hypothetical protein
MQVGKGKWERASGREGKWGKSQRETACADCPLRHPVAMPIPRWKEQPATMSARLAAAHAIRSGQRARVVAPSGAVTGGPPACLQDGHVDELALAPRNERRGAGGARRGGEAHPRVDDPGTRIALHAPIAIASTLGAIISTLSAIIGTLSAITSTLRAITSTLSAGRSPSARCPSALRYSRGGLGSLCRRNGTAPRRRRSDGRPRTTGSRRSVGRSRRRSGKPGGRWAPMRRATTQRLQ